MSSTTYPKPFQEALHFCKEKNLFLGLGNPNAKILILGKEHYHDHESTEDTDEFYDEILSARESDNKRNIAGWEQNIMNVFQPNFDEIKFPLRDENPEIAWYFQNNKGNRKLKNGDWNSGTSGTYLSYS